MSLKPPRRQPSLVKEDKANEKTSLLMKETQKTASLQKDVEESKVEEPASEGSTLIIAFVLMLFFQLGNRIFGRLQTYPMHNYPIFMNLLSVFIYIPISFMYILPMIKFGKQITQEQLAIPQYKFAVMGMWDSVAGIMQTFSVNYISNASTVVLVQQSAIPISMMISKITLNARYTSSQYSGASIVMLGIVAVLLPSLSQSSGNSTGSAELFWIFVLVLSCVPMCLSSVYKEKALGEVEIDVVYLNGCVAFFQFLFAIPICIPSAEVINVSTSQILPNIWDGMRCWFGIDTLESDQCSSAPFFVTAYLAFNIVYNILTVIVLKHGSANILWMASTVIVPLSDLAFSLPFMPNHKPMTIFDVIGLVIIMLGLTIYRFSSQVMSLMLLLSGKTDTVEEVEMQRKVREISKKAEQKQTNFIGLNQLEGIESLFDSRIVKEQKQALHHTTQQIRGNLFVKLGIPPSPMISVGPPSRQGKYTPSPSLRVNSVSPVPGYSISKVSDLRIPSRTNSTPKGAIV